MHSLGVRAAGQHDLLGKLLHKMLDRRHETVIKRFATDPRVIDGGHDDAKTAGGARRFCLRVIFVGKVIVSERPAGRAARRAASVLGTHLPVAAGRQPFQTRAQWSATCCDRLCSGRCGAMRRV
jgi:hypothetical protein